MACSGFRTRHEAAVGEAVDGSCVAALNDVQTGIAALRATLAGAGLLGALVDAELIDALGRRSLIEHICTALGQELPLTYHLQHIVGPLVPVQA